MSGNPAPTRIELELINRTIPHGEELPVHIADVFPNGEDPLCKVFQTYQQEYASMKKVDGIWRVYLKKMMPAEPFEVTVAASNDHGGVSHTFTFEILPAPEPEREPQEITVTEQPTILGMGHIGERLVANLGKADGWPEITTNVIWTRNGEPVEWVGILDTHEMNEGDEIQLFVIRTNDLGRVEVSTDVLVLSAMPEHPNPVGEPELVAEYLFDNPVPPEFTHIQRQDVLHSAIMAPAYLDQTGLRRVIENPNTHRIDYEGTSAGLLLEPQTRHWHGNIPGKWTASSGAIEAQNTDEKNLNGSNRWDYTFPAISPTTQITSYPRVWTSRDWPARSVNPAEDVEEYISYLVKAPKRADNVIVRFQAAHRGGNQFVNNGNEPWMEVNLTTGEVTATGGNWFIRATVESATDGLWKLCLDARKVTAAGANFSQYDRMVIAPVSHRDEAVTMHFEEFQTFVFPNAEEQAYPRKPVMLLTPHSTSSNTGEVLRLSENLGTVDLEIDTPEGTIHLYHQTMRGDWTYAPERPMKITAIRAYVQGEMQHAPDPTDIPAYVAEIMSMPEAGHHMTHSAMVADHSRLLNLVPRDRNEVTHVAVKSADCSSRPLGKPARFRAMGLTS